MTMITAVNEEDKLLLQGIITADSKRIREVYALALPAVIRWVEENSGTEQDARDIFQEAIIALYKKLESGEFTLTCTLKSFLRIMCRNLWLSRLRRRKVLTVVSEESEENIPMDDDILLNLEQAERQRLFLFHFSKLGDKCRQILNGFFQKKRLKKIAEEMGTSESYIKKRKFHCKETLVNNIRKDPTFQELID